MSALRTRNTLEQDDRARRVLTDLVLAAGGGAAELSEMLEYCALRPGQEDDRVSSLEVGAIDIRFARTAFPVPGAFQ